jgi:ribose/xylose/arabinose/galactoside ABC-type transport system permease subunit
MEKKYTLSFSKIFKKGGIYLILLILVGVSSIISPDFYHSKNIFNILEQSSFKGIVSLGQTLVILGGGIDLSVASVMSCVNVLLAAFTLGRNEVTLQAIFICLVFGSLVGLINGVIIVKKGVPPFIVTLGMMIILQGLRLIYTKGAPWGYIPSIIRFLGVGRIMGSFPISFIIFLIIAGLSYIVLKNMIFGRQLYAVGVNERAAHSSGVNTDLIRIITYVVCGLLAAVSGIILSGYINTADNWAAQGYEFYSIAAVVVGGTMLEGGRGGVHGTVAGVILIALMTNLMVFAGLGIEMQLIGQSLILIAGISLYMRIYSKQ